MSLFDRMGLNKQNNWDLNLFARDYENGVIPSNYFSKDTPVPEHAEESLEKIERTVARIFYSLFYRSNERLYHSFLKIIEEYANVDDEDLEKLQEAEDKNYFAELLSVLDHYYFCPDGLTVQLDDSSPSLSFTYLVGESVLHVSTDDCVGDENETVITDLGAVLLSEATIKKLNDLLKEALAWNDGKSFYAYYSRSFRRNMRIYTENAKNMGTR